MLLWSLVVNVQKFNSKWNKRIVYEKSYEHTNSEIISKFLEDNGVKNRTNSCYFLIKGFFFIKNKIS